MFYSRRFFTRTRFPAWPLALALGIGVVLIPSTALYAEAEFIPVDEYVGPDGLSGDAIYERILENRFDAFSQTLSMRSGDEGGNYQLVEMEMKYKRYDPKKKGVISKTIAKYTEPQDVRHLGYLIINKESGQDDQFVYRPSARKVRRVNVRGESIAGTDLAFEDVVPPEFDDGTHHRMPDEEVAGIKTFVIAMVPKLSTESEYAKIMYYVDQERFVPIRTRYWDNKRVLIKRMDADPESLSRFEDVDNLDGPPRTVWIAQKSEMKNLKSGSFTRLEIEDFKADPRLRDRDFSQRQLTNSH